MHAAFTETPTAWFRLPLTAKEAADRWEVRAQVPVGRHARAFLRDAAGKELAHADTDRVGKLAFRDLGLPAGDTFVEVQEENGELVEAVAALSTGLRVEGSEAEPNDHWVQANRVDPGPPLTGRWAWEARPTASRSPSTRGGRPPLVTRNRNGRRPRSGCACWAAPVTRSNARCGRGAGSE